MEKNIIKSIILCLILIATPLFIQAQTTEKVAFINSVELLEAIPAKAKASKTINDLNQKYKNELQIMQNDYNKKYSDFITYQNSMAESIKLRRMQELYELEKNIDAFMKVAQEDINSQEEYLIKPLKEQLKAIVQEVGLEYNFTCIYDLANPSIAFITPNAIDANPIVKQKLKAIK